MVDVNCELVLTMKTGKFPISKQQGPVLFLFVVNEVLGKVIH